MIFMCDSYRHMMLLQIAEFFASTLGLVLLEESEYAVKDNHEEDGDT